MPPNSSSERQLIARLAAHTSWAQTPDRSARTAAARAGLQLRFENQVDPDRQLAPAERFKRAESARRAFYVTLALKSAQVRRKSRQLVAKADTDDHELAA